MLYDLKSSKFLPEFWTPLHFHPILQRRSKGITEEKQIESANLQLIRFNLKKKVPAVFLDLEVADNSSKSATDIDSLKAFKRESNKLWKFILEQPSLKIKTMTDVLEDLQALTAKTNQLEGNLFFDLNLV